jgi:hypothetical protein
LCYVEHRVPFPRNPFSPVTVLVGRSGTGKSNLVQAIRFLRNFLLNPGEAINYEFGWEGIIPAGQKGAKTSLEVSFTVPGEGREYNYQIGFARAGNANPTLHVESLALGNDTLFSRFRNATSPAQWNWKVAPKVEPMPLPGGKEVGQEVERSFTSCPLSSAWAMAGVA